MKAIRVELHVEHNGNIFRRVTTEKNDRASWELKQESPEYELWTTVSIGAAEALEKEYLIKNKEHNV